MNLISVNNFELGNGIEAKAEKAGKIYTAYLQLPDCPDSLHSFLDGTKDDDLLMEIVDLVESKYSKIKLNMITFAGYDANYEEFNYGSYDYYVVLDEELGYPVLKESFYSGYYRTLLLEPLDENSIDLDEEKELIETIEAIRKKHRKE